MAKLRFLYITLLNIILLRNVCGMENIEKNYIMSLPNLQELLLKEKLMVKYLDKYVDSLQLKLNSLREFVTDIKGEHSRSEKSTYKYLTNPLNSYKLIRRMHKYWRNLVNYITQLEAEDAVEMMEILCNDFPTEKDLMDSVDSIYRIQVVYDLQPKDLANGLLNGVQYNSQFDSVDTFYIGSTLLKGNKTEEAGLWLFESLVNFKPSHFHQAIEFNKSCIHQEYAEFLVKQKRYNEAIDILKIDLRENSNDLKVEDRMLDIYYLAKSNGSDKYEPAIKPITDYEKACRGHFNKAQNMKCLYNHTSSYFARLAPFKMEIISLDPFLVIYYNIITDEEIEVIQDIASRNFSRATVGSAKKQNNIRISQVAWITDFETIITRRLRQRLADMSGLNFQNSSTNQIASYLPGGHYGVHYDILCKSGIYHSDYDRIATILIYMNNVEQGGATVFPDIQRSILPQKGSAALWYNFDNNYNCNVKTKHAACPVIVGSKLILTKWIKGIDQILQKPCLK